jgi:hypothetical protein
VKSVRILMAMACMAAAVAGAGYAQQPPRGGPSGRGPAGGFARGFAPGPGYRRGPAPGPGYGRAPQGYGSPYYGQPGYAPGGYAPYGPPLRPPEAPRAALGGWREQQDVLRQGVRQGQLAPLGRVIGSIRQRTPGRQLDAHLEYLGPRMVYRVVWVTDQGRRVDYFVDAATGAILSGR